MAKKAKLIPRKFLSSDEGVVFESRPSAWLYMKSAALAFLIMVIAGAIYSWEWIPEVPDLPSFLSSALTGENGKLVRLAFAAIAFVAFVFFVGKWLSWGSTVYAATDERVIKQKGILNKVYVDIPVTMIANIDMKQSLGKRFMGYGTLVFSTQGLGGRKADMVWEGVPNPMSVRRKLQEVMDIRVKPKR